jgi:putative membrane protein
MNFIIRLVTNTIALLGVAYTIKGVHIEGIAAALVAALIFALINTFLKPIIILITLPINILSLGLFTLFINGFLFYAVSKFVKGFSVDGFWSAFWGALIFSIISFLINMFIGKNHSNVSVHRFRQRTPASNHPSSYPNVVDTELVDEDKDKNNKLGA